MIKNLFKNKKILITGGAGSIGKEIVKRLFKYRPSTIRVFDHNESALFWLKQELKNEKNLRFLIGDVRDKDRLQRALEGIDIVFHAAALKHVPLCEYNPFEAVCTNIIGTQNLIEASLLQNVEKVIFISTDKVTHPINVMGATKLLGERLIAATQNYRGTRKTSFTAVRFGNVINSEGSVIPLFKNQVKNGGPLTITDLHMTRFMMSFNQAVNLIFKAVELMSGGEVFIFKMPAIKILDLAKIIIKKFSENKELKIKQIGLRPGEKLHEELLTSEEIERTLETEEMFILLPEINLSKKNVYPGAKKTKIKSYNSSQTKFLSKEQISSLINDD